jgi:hypothetical protein
MKDSKYNHRFFLGLVVLTAGLLSVGILPSNASKSIRSNRNPTQNLELPRARAEKYIGKYRIYPNEPVIVTDLTINGTQHEINRKVTAGEDWLNGLTFKVKNISNKNIVFIYVSLLFPEAKAITGTLFAFDLRYGADPRLEAASTTEKPIKPEEEAEFVVSDASYQNLKRGIETRITPIKNINSVQIDVVRVIFDDDSAWATGSFMHRDPNNPKRWIDNN